ncbi:uncharacterized protein UV8b_03349 [Ustilaginoidea virens]|uniref:Uncharacterized protein n=1 Tax=Ustilaginoidea virens TaxID=1159556 RepID=A0A063BT55_USTVR|nr:uncharacterized protein UV8b_03349 [Ustilaginoidea virens]ARS01305.1 hypothetical protein [Ustilaginoidea virens]QUC19108.1 hypothetical protein UV8b_03349 [Ustilaginoidea virens]GAO20043.1 hypothetical protein UVI_02063300 [Ustilaginoidea virens]
MRILRLLAASALVAAVPYPSSNLKRVPEGNEVIDLQLQADEKFRCNMCSRVQKIYVTSPVDTICTGEFCGGDEEHAFVRCRRGTQHRDNGKPARVYDIQGTVGNSTNKKFCQQFYNHLSAKCNQGHDLASDPDAVHLKCTEVYRDEYPLKFSAFLELRAWDDETDRCVARGWRAGFKGTDVNWLGARGCHEPDEEKKEEARG